MIERKFLPAVLVVGFLVTAGASGGATFAVLSDGAGVSVGIPADASEAWTVTTTSGNATPSNATASQNGTASQVPNATATLNSVNGDAIAVALTPATQSSAAGEVATYDVVVKGAEKGIVSYDMTFELSDSSVARFEGYTSDESYLGDGVEVTEDRLSVNGAPTPGSDTIGETGLDGRVTLGTIKIEGVSGGRTDITIVNETGYTADVVFTNKTGNFVDYDIGAMGDGVLTVTNDAPTANPDTYPTKENQSLDVASERGVLKNDRDPDGDDMTASIVSQPSNGDLTLDQDGSFTYEPDAGFVGTDSFTYRVKDGSGGTDTATVSINVTEG